MPKFPKLSFLSNNNGAVAIIVALTMIVFLGVGALAVDIGHLSIVRNELQNAADAGALAGALDLYNDEGTSVNVGANQTAYDTAIANTTDGTAVYVNWTGENTGEVQRGHWSFSTHTFTAHGNEDAVPLWDYTEDELDVMPEFINAVRVVARTQQSGAASFFARIFGHDSFQVSAEAVAYRGYAGTFAPGDFDQPVAICHEALWYGGKLNCNVGRMINSGGNLSTHGSGGWTNFEQPCSGAANTPSITDAICGGGNEDPIDANYPMTATGGEVTPAIRDIRDCFMNRSDADQPWEVTLPVIECPGNNVGNCENITGAITLKIVWISDNNDKIEDAPTDMGDWDAAAIDPALMTNHEARWDSFVGHFGLNDVDDSGALVPAPFRTSSIYFLPLCEFSGPQGGPGGNNYGVLARIPVLVD
jgi:Flp pilus assembly protein TadG